jgi:hypothetical protein
MFSAVNVRVDYQLFVHAAELMSANTNTYFVSVTQSFVATHTPHLVKVYAT